MHELKCGNKGAPHESEAFLIQPFHFFVVHIVSDLLPGNIGAKKNPWLEDDLPANSGVTTKNDVRYVVILKRFPFQFRSGCYVRILAIQLVQSFLKSLGAIRIQEFQYELREQISRLKSMLDADDQSNIKYASRPMWRERIISTP